MSTADPLQLTEHHLNPKSLRMRIRNNKVMIWRGLHEAWHILFRVFAPEDVIAELVRYWLVGQNVEKVFVRTRYWSGTLRPLVDRYRSHPKKLRAYTLVFPTQLPLEVLKLWAWNWVPKDYLYELCVTIDGSVYHIPPDCPDTDFLQKIRHRQECKLKEASQQNST